MDMDNAATILSGSILTMLALIVIVIGIVVINNIFHKYWKPIKWMSMQNHPMFITHDEVYKQEPVAETSTATNTVNSATVILK